MKPFMLLCADPPVEDVAAAFELGLRVIAVGSGPDRLAGVAGAFERFQQSRELVLVDADTIARSGMTQALSADRRPSARELLIRGALAYTGMPEAAILYAHTDLPHLADVCRRASRRPAVLGVRDAQTTQTELLFELGYRTILLHQAGSRRHILATDEDLTDISPQPDDPLAGRRRALRRLMLAILASG